MSNCTYQMPTNAANRMSGWGLVRQDIMRDSSLSVESKAIYAYLCSIAGTGGVCYPSVDTMMRDLDVSRGRLVKHMRALVAAGVIEKTRERNGNLLGKNVYKIVSAKEISKGIRSDNSRPPQIRSIETRQVESRPLENSAINNNKANKNNKIKTVNTYSHRFGDFWAIYPRKQEKSRAYKEFCARLNDGFSEDELIQSAQKYALECEKEKREPRYIKLASTFLGINTPFIDFLQKGDENSSAADTDSGGTARDFYQRYMGTGNDNQGGTD